MPATWVPWPKQSSESPSPKLEKPDLAREPVCVQDSQSAGCSSDIAAPSIGAKLQCVLLLRMRWGAVQAGTTCQTLCLVGIRISEFIMIQSNALR
jgi:hypothetical protein